MARTCLILTVQLSPADLQLVREILADIKLAHKQTIQKAKNTLNIDFFRFECIIQDLSEIVLQSKINEFRFNLYILKMAIVKLEFILSEIQLATDQTTLDIYNSLSKCKVKLSALFTGLIEPI